MLLETEDVWHTRRKDRTAQRKQAEQLAAGGSGDLSPVGWGGVVLQQIRSFAAEAATDRPVCC